MPLRNRSSRARTSIAAYRPPREPTIKAAPGAVVPVSTGWNKQCIDDWRENSRARRLADTTITLYDSKIRHFMDWCTLNKLSILDIGPRELRAYMDDLRENEPIAEQTIGNIFTALSSLFEFFVERGDIPDNIVPYFRRRYLQIPLRESRKRRFERKQFLSVRDMRRLVRSISDVQERLVIVLAAKTGLRVGELVAVDVIDIDWKSESIRVKPQRKRTHLIAFFDAETERLLSKWLTIRDLWTKDDAGPLFLGPKNERMKTSDVSRIVRRTTTRIGLTKPHGEKHEKVSPHTLRHWFTTHLHRGGIRREHLKVLRGDALPETVDIYTAIDYDDLRADYLKCIPRIVGGPHAPPEKARERKARNPTFGFLTPREVALKGNGPGPVSLELRARIANDLRKKKLKRPAKYVEWLVKHKGLRLDYARPLVSKQLRVLRVPSLSHGPRSGEGWQLQRKAVSEKAMGKT